MATGDPNLTKVIQRYEKRMVFFEALLRQLCELCVDTLQANTPGHSLPDEWTYTLATHGDRVEAKVYTTRLDRTDQNWELILTWLDLGTKAHFVKPIRALALHWVDPNSGEDRFSKGHMVSGIQPSHFLAKTDRMIQDFEATIQKKWDAYMNRGTLPK